MYLYVPTSASLNLRKLEIVVVWLDCCCGRNIKMESRWRAYDTNEGIEVAWNVVKLSRTPPSERKRIKTEVKLLKVRTRIPR